MGRLDALVSLYFLLWNRGKYSYSHMHKPTTCIRWGKLCRECHGYSRMYNATLYI